MKGLSSLLIAVTFSMLAWSDETEDANEFKVQVFYVRHGQSCSNAAPRLDLGTEYRDPPLTDCGLYRSIQSGEQFHQFLAEHNIIVDFKGASRLLRAQETLLMMAYDDYFIGNEKLYILPYIGEAIGGFELFPQNMPLSLRSQKNLLIKSFPRLAKLNISDKYIIGTDADEVDYKSFVKETLPKIAKDLYQAQPKSIYRAVIVSHSQLMFNSMGCMRQNIEAPENNEVFSIIYRLRQGHNGLEVFSYSLCEQLMVVNKPWTNAPFNDKDRIRCSYKAPSKGPIPHPLNFSVGQPIRDEWVKARLSVQCKQ